MHDPHRSLLETMRYLRVALKPGADSGRLFEARDRLHGVADDLIGGAARLGPLCGIVERLLSEVVRHGEVSEPEALAAAKDLVRYVEEELEQARSQGQADGAQEQSEPPLKLELQPGSGAPLRIVHAGPAQTSSARTPAEPPPSDVPQRDSSDGSGEAPHTGTQTPFVQLNLDDVDESRLGELLVNSGSVSAADMHRALGLQHVTRRRLGDILVGMGLVEESRLRDALERQRLLTLQMARGLQGHPGGLEIRVGDPELGSGEPRQGLPDAG